MCLKNISKKSVSDGDAVMYKVFVCSVDEATFLVSPFEHTPLTEEMLDGKAEYTANRHCFPESFFEETAVMLRDKISDGFVHGYADKQSALKDLYRFYSSSFTAAVLIKCSIPKREAYYDGDFDEDKTVTARATRAVTVERVEEMYVCRMTAEDHERYGEYHVFVRKNQSPRRCVAFLKRMYDKVYPQKKGVAYRLPEYMYEIPDSLPDLYNQ